jgi:dipeptidyl aminopeptidase/acylaminoacyl peptidase
MALGCLADGALSQVIEPAQVKRPVQIDDLFSWRELPELRISPDGKYIVFVVNAVADDANKRTSDLWLVATDDASEPVQITRHSGNDAAPRWSPDSRAIAFLSDRDDDSDEGVQQIYLWRLAGGEPERLTKIESGVTHVEWSADGQTLYFLSPDEPSQQRQSRLEKNEQDDAQPVEQGFQFSHLWALNLATRQSRRLTRGEFHITDFSLSPDGRRIAFCAAPTPLLNYETQTELYVIDAAGGPRRRLTENGAAETQPRWSPDGGFVTFAANANQDGTMHYVALSRLFAVPAAGGKVMPLMGGMKNGLVVEVGAHFWSANGNSIWLLVDSGFTHQLVELPVSDDDDKLTPGEPIVRDEGKRVMTLVDASRDTSLLAFGWESSTAARDIYVATRNNIAKARQRTNLNPQIDHLKLAPREIVHWQSRDGQQIEGLLYYPHDLPRDGDARRMPLLVNIHGGPLAADKNCFLMDMVTYPHLAAAHGFGTLFVNYRGSTGYGDAFARAIVGNYYTKDVADILSGVDALVDRGIADPKRLGIQGWSNGGILTTWITTETTRFRAAAVGAADVNWFSDFGTADIALPFDLEYFRGRPWDQRQHYLEKSPLFRMDKVRTPTLILHGEADVRVPLGQGQEHFRALKEIGKAHVEMILFPREEHTFAEIAHQKTKVAKELEWFQHYIDTAAEAAPKEPLAAPLSARLAQHGGMYGEWIANVLVPETAPLSALNDTASADPKGNEKATRLPLLVGRFEVTNAQFQHFVAERPHLARPAVDEPYKAVAVWQGSPARFLTGYANHPVTGVTPLEAEQYCRWLSQKTGRSYRLPTSEEWTEIASAGEEHQFPWGDEFSADRGNSASIWGEKTTFDARSLFTSAAGRQLLDHRLPTQQVGSYTSDKLHLHDISGNAWELCRHGQQFVARGGGWTSSPAELTLDARLNIPAEGRRGDVGFRVVREP